MKWEDEDFIQLFFKQTIEDGINSQMMEYSYELPVDNLIDYIQKVCSIPFVSYLNYIRRNTKFKVISSNDITQISDYKNCEINFCNALQGIRRPLSNEEVGVLLQSDGVIRNSTANTKYGENHAKAALQLGLAQNRYGYWYLSCLGKVFPLLNKDLRASLLARTLLRSNLYAQIIVGLLQGDVSVESIWSSANLSLSTKERRRSSVRCFLQMCCVQAVKEGYNFAHSIDFTIGEKREILSFNTCSAPSN